MMTLSKLAKLAHVSLSTASKAFSMSSEVNEETREMIFNIAREHGCFKKFYNAKYPRFVVAVICPELRSRHYSILVSYIQGELSKRGCEMCVASTDFSPQTSKELYDYYNNYSNVDGIILIDGGKDWIQKNNIPIVSSGKHINSAVNVSTDFSDGIRMAADYFIEKGITDIGFISEPYTVSKLNLFKEYMHEKGIENSEEYLSLSSERMEKGGYLAMEELFKKEKLPRAVICSYDCMAIGAMRCIFDHGLRIPEDIAIIGINNNRESQYLNPPLSSIDTGESELSKIMAEAIVNKIMGKETKDNFVIKPRLILRKSSEI